VAIEQREGQVTTHGQTDDHHLVDVEGAEQGSHLVGVARHRIARFVVGSIRGTEALEVRGYDPAPPREGIELRLPHPRVEGERVQQQQRRTVGVGIDVDVAHGGALDGDSGHGPPLPLCPTEA